MSCRLLLFMWMFRSPSDSHLPSSSLCRSPSSLCLMLVLYLKLALYGCVVLYDVMALIMFFTLPDKIRGYDSVLCGV